MTTPSQDSTQIRVRLEAEDQPLPVPLHRDEVQITYHEADYLDQGALGAVYKGVADVADEPLLPVVIKVAHSREKERTIHKEYELLREQYQRYRYQYPSSETVPLPIVRLGQIEPVTDDAESASLSRRMASPALVMPFYEPDSLLVKQLRPLILRGSKADLLNAEKLALQAAIAFTKVMNLPRDWTCTDRKVRDFYRIEGDHVVVLDWNVIREDRPAYRESEIRLVGYLWHTFFMEYEGNAPYQPFFDPDWQPVNYPAHGVLSRGTMSVGLRVILAQLVAYRRRDDATPDFTPVIAAFENWLDCLNRAEAPPVRELQQVLQVFSADTPFLTAEALEAVRFDLAWRLSGDDSLIDERDKQLETAHQEQVGDPLIVQRERISADVGRDPVRALSSIEAKRDESKEQGDRIRQAHLTRWILLIKVMQSLRDVDNLSRRDRADIERLLRDVGEGLHQVPVDDSPEQLSGWLTRLDDLMRSDYEGLNRGDLAQVYIELQLRAKASVWQNMTRLKARRQWLVYVIETVNNLLLDAGAVSDELAYFEGHYLAVSGDVLRSDLQRGNGQETLLTQILDNYQLIYFSEQVDTLADRLNEFLLSSRDDPDSDADEMISSLFEETFALYFVLQETATDASSDDWLEHFTGADVAFLAFVDEYFRQKRLQLTYPGLLRVVYRGASHLADKEFVKPKTSRWQTVQLILRAYQAAGYRLLDEALATDDGLYRRQPIDNAEPAYRALDQILDDKRWNLPPSDTQQTHRDHYRDYRRFFNQWDKALVAFINRSDDEAIQTILNLLDKARGGKIAMSDLLSAESLEANKKLLESKIGDKIRQKLQNLQSVLLELKDLLDTNRGELDTLIDRVSESAGRYQQELDTRQSGINKQVDALQKSWQAAKTQQALLAFRPGQIPEPKTLSGPMRTQYMEVQQLAGNPEFLEAVQAYYTGDEQPNSVLPVMQDLQVVVRAGQIQPEHTHLKPEFFTDSRVQQAANKCTVLGYLLELYWRKRLENVSDLALPGLRISIVQPSQDVAATIQQDLAGMIDAFHRGDLATAEERLKGLLGPDEQSVEGEPGRARVYDGHKASAKPDVELDALTASLLEQIMQTWRGRIAQKKRARGFMIKAISRVESSTPIPDKLLVEKHIDIVLNRLQQLREASGYLKLAVLSASPEVWGPDMQQRLQSDFSDVEKQLNTLNTRIPVDLDEMKMLHLDVQNQIEAARDEALLRGEEHLIIYQEMYPDAPSADAVASNTDSEGRING